MTGSTLQTGAGTPLTRNQSLVLEALTAADGPLGAYAILDRVRHHGVRAPAQVYRALERLRDLGLVHRLDTMNAFVACRHGHGVGASAATGAAGDPAPVVFVICEHCGATRELEDAVIGRRLSALARAEGFGLQASNVELRGTCAACAQTRSGSST